MKSRVNSRTCPASIRPAHGKLGRERSNERLDHLNVEKTSLFNIRSSLARRTAGPDLALVLNFNFSLAL
jgi:hypothetical protein